jgi:predicted protein tyrosine phosphatase
MPLINALRRCTLACHRGIPRSRAAALVRRAICVAVLSEENQKLMPLVPCSTPGGMLKVSERPSVDRADACVVQTM